MIDGMESVETGTETEFDGGTEAADETEVNDAVENDEAEESNDSEDSEEGSESTPEASKSEKAKIKAQLRELGEDDMDALVTIKVGGETKRVTLKEAIAISEQGANEVNQVKAQFVKMARMAKENPEAFLERFGVDVDQMSEARLAKKLEELSMTPEQKAQKAEKEELERYRSMEKKQKEEAEREHKTRAEREAADTLDREITDAFKESGLPKDPFYVQLMAAQMLAADKRGQSVSAKQAAQAVKSKFTTHVNSILGTMDSDALLSFLGDNVRKVIREAELKRATGKAPVNVDSAGKAGKPAAPTKPRPGKPMNEREWREWLQKQ